MKKLLIILLAISPFFISCNGVQTGSNKDEKDTIIIHDTIFTEGCYTYNLPCKVEYINQDKEGKSILVFWLHGGVHDRGAHNLLNTANNHIDQWRNKAYNGISAYLHESGTKAIYIAPVCHKAENPACVNWIACADDIKKIIDDYVSNNAVDPKRVYVAGCSDGGAGTWDLIEQHGDWFAAAMPFSCGNPRLTKVPIYYSTTSAEGDMTSSVTALKNSGSNIKKYTFCPEEKHGGDEKLVLQKNYLKEFFSNSKQN